MAAGVTYIPISSYTVSGSSTSAYTFSSIPGTYTNLYMMVNGYCGGGYYTVRFNGDSGTNYSRTLLFTQSGSPTSYRNTNDTNLYGNLGDSTTNIGNTFHHINNYANATTYKTVIRQGGGQDTYAPQIEAGVWRATPQAITSITLTSSSGVFGSGTVMSLYGIAAA